ncbi:cytochrome c oxidase subunit 4 isoform 1, mitochondrial-like [Anoplophora glabripennis]|uniref:cytochrome c oxidase subunit 4 isoform 1, mitochondrial-like n=1 Tax=Anoplophora glabripennis TaxID=217634 RepID=UPI000873FD63|nr:cytochrome c oxidase subunit 4 isoform 1, mitochondrial-like [Anoplophora glabripennis]
MVSKIYISQRSMGYMANRCKYWLERVGNREMVGFGMNGTPMYLDRPDFPFSAIRYKETTPELQALYEKQKGDWRLLTKEEKKTLYRANFCQTYAEFQAPTGEWMEVIGYALIFCCLGVWLFIIESLTIHKSPESFKPAWVRAQMRRQIDLQVNPITGLASNWDYEKEDWKVKKWNTPSNPFIKCPDDDD